MAKERRFGFFNPRYSFALEKLRAEGNGRREADAWRKASQLLREEQAVQHLPEPGEREKDRERGILQDREERLTVPERRKL